MGKAFAEISSTAMAKLKTKVRRTFRVAPLTGEMSTMDETKR